MMLGSLFLQTLPPKFGKNSSMIIFVSCNMHVTPHGLYESMYTRDGTRIFQSGSWDPYVCQIGVPSIFGGSQNLWDPPDSCDVQELIVGNVCIHP